ncbi:MAG TPA: alpha/beta fold hydrolase, partial [Ktedonobacteraceae bacterium]|nr:alpha/beta fold hydrolase [Ktedonobacteraceae bacterium]
LPMLVTLAVAGGATAALAAQVYRRPVETAVSVARAGLLLAGVREETCDVGNFPIHFYCAGRRGTPVVLIHGMGNSAEVWSSVIVRLRKECLVYALDLPGFGKTPAAPEGYNIATHALYVKRFIDALGYPRVTLVGNSLGGWIATRFAVAYPERVDRLYLLNSAGLRHEQMNSPYAIDRAAAQRSANHMLGYPLPLPGFILDAIVRISQMPAYTNFVTGYDSQEELDSVLSQVHAPTTIIWGEQDKVFPITCARDLHSGIAHSELIILQGVGHLPQMQASAKVAKIILKDCALREEQ